MKQEFSAILLDLDGTLLDTETVAQRAWIQAANEFGYDFDGETYLTLLGRTIEGAQAILRETFGDAFPYEECRARRVELSREDFALNGVRVKHGGKELLTHLSDRKIKRAVATSTRKVEALKKIELAGIAPHLEIGAFGDEVLNGKPDPEIYLLAAERLGVDPSLCLVFEDSEAGAEGAYRAGMKCLFVPDLKHPSEGAKDFIHAVLPSLEEAIGYIQDNFDYK